MLKIRILMQFMPNKKDIAFFADSIPRGMKMKDMNFKIKGGTIYLKPFPGVRSKQLNHYVKPTWDEHKYDSGIVDDMQKWVVIRRVTK